LYNVALDPAESYDMASLHPDIVSKLLSDLESLVQTFPPDVVEAYTMLKANVGAASTPPGASPRLQDTK
jgi:arylsulfatase